MRITPVLNGEKKIIKYAFYCEGCDTMHQVVVNSPAETNNWIFNGDLINPTITPSVLVTKPRHPDASEICHSFITNGKIQFLNDSTHHLAGQTIELTEFPTNELYQL